MKKFFTEMLAAVVKLVKRVYFVGCSAYNTVCAAALAKEKSTLNTYLPYAIIALIVLAPAFYSGLLTLIASLVLGFMSWLIMFYCIARIFTDLSTSFNRNAVAA